MKKTTEKENYLKLLYKFEEKKKVVSVTELAEYFKVSKSTVSNMIKKLVKMGFVDTQPYKDILLTNIGRKKAIEITSKHRLIELYLVREMHFELDEVHEIAEEIEHIENSEFFNRMRSILGDATLDPHGSVIPKSKY
jgi:DtxR family Mn-dependent transcriptional regulator|tara:strand:- start:1106 stop:1516 length:411 start_codon:yes stop_codon:yes gene_type:complete